MEESSLKNSIVLSIPVSFHLHNIMDELTKEYNISIDNNNQLNQKFYDTFDWRLYNNGLLLTKDNKTYCLKKLGTSEIITEEASNSNSHPKFWWDFHESDMKEKMKKVLDVRSLLFLLSIERNTDVLKILNIQNEFSKKLEDKLNYFKENKNKRGKEKEKTYQKKLFH